MSDPTDTGQRNPLSSSRSHASGTSARSVSIQPEAAPSPAVAAQDDVAPAPSAEVQPEAGAELQAEMTQPVAAEWSDEPTESATEEQVLVDAPEVVADFSPAPAEYDAEYSQPSAEPHAESVDDAEADAFEKDLAPLGAVPEATIELRAIARQTIAENDARQQQTLALFEQVSRRFTAALEEAGVDAARVTFKVMELAQASLKNNLELAKSYAAARSVPDIFGLHAAYLTKQFELLNAQAEELREITTKMTSRSAASWTPRKESAGGTLDQR